MAMGLGIALIGWLIGWVIWASAWCIHDGPYMQDYDPPRWVQSLFWPWYVVLGFLVLVITVIYDLSKNITIHCRGRTRPSGSA